MRTVEDDGRTKRLFIGIEQSDHELVVALADAHKLAFRRIGAKVNVDGHGTRVHPLAESSAGALDALGVSFSEFDSLAGHAGRLLSEFVAPVPPTP